MLQRLTERKEWTFFGVLPKAAPGLAAAGMTIPGELARVTGLSRPEAGRGNRALVAEGYAANPAPGVYRLLNGDDGPFSAEHERDD